MDLRKYIGKTKSLEQDIVRTLLIIYHFGLEVAAEDDGDELKLVLRSEYYIQKLDFLLRNPDYLCLELLCEIRNGTIQDKQLEVKAIVCDIYRKEEPILRRIPMQRFFYGAYEKLDEVESFLTSVDFLKVRPQGNLDRIQVKNYYLTVKGYDYITQELLPNCIGVDWYNHRCFIVKQFLGHISASALKNRQYGYESYSEARWGSEIISVSSLVNEKYIEIFGENLDV